MKRTLDFSKPFYHGTNLRLELLRAGSMVTQWEALARTFSHKPSSLCYEDDGAISHNGIQDENAVFLTCRELKLRLMKEVC